MADPVLAESRSRTPLLDLVRDDALEAEYRLVSTRRPDDGDRAPSRSARAAGLAVVAVFGLLVTVAAVQTTRNADTQEASRAQVINRIEDNRAALRSGQATLAELRSEITAAEGVLVDLGGSLGEEESRADRIAAQAGFRAVTGPGVRITVDNPPRADPYTEVVRDSDLAALVNGLWVAGAEAVSINGHRITGVSGIRNVGTNVTVNSDAISPPYVVSAIGNPDRLAGDLLSSASGGEFYSIARQFGWSEDTRQVAELRIPAAGAGLRRLRSAQQMTEETEGRKD